MKTLSGHYVTVIDGLLEIETSFDAKLKLNYIEMYFATSFNSVAIAKLLFSKNNVCIH